MLSAATDRVHVVSVSSSAAHNFSKQQQSSIQLIAGLGVQGDAHAGAAVQHLYLKRRNAHAPNLMQVHLLPQELLTDIAGHGFPVAPGQLGENVTTAGIDLRALPLGTRLHLGSDAVVELTCLRSPCQQIERFRPGLLQQMVGRDDNGESYPRVGVMGVVLAGGQVNVSDPIQIVLPAAPHVALTTL